MYCRRLVACLGLLSRPDLCILDGSLWDQCPAPYVLVGIVRDLSYRAGSLFTELFDILKKCLELPRSAGVFRQRVSTLAFCIGLIYRSLETFALSKDQWSDKVRRSFQELIF